MKVSVSIKLGSQLILNVDFSEYRQIWEQRYVRTVRAVPGMSKL